MERQVDPLDAFEFGFQPLLRRVHDDLRTLAEQQPLDLDEAEQTALADPFGVDLEELALVEEDDLIDPFGRHVARRGRLRQLVLTLAQAIPAAAHPGGVVRWRSPHRAACPQRQLPHSPAPRPISATVRESDG